MRWSPFPANPVGSVFQFVARTRRRVIAKALQQCQHAGQVRAAGAVAEEVGSAQGGDFLRRRDVDEDDESSDGDDSDE